MVAYSFQERFAEPILAGTKRQTIRAVGSRRHARPGETLQLYVGMRTRRCRLIATRECVSTCAVRICVADPCVMFGDHAPLRSPYELDVFARFDGFADWTDLAAFWRARHPEASQPDMIFEGVLIQWDPLS